jgi:hypothetical protein
VATAALVIGHKQIGEKKSQRRFPRSAPINICSGLNPADSGVPVPRCNPDALYLRDLVDQSSASWNPMISWLRNVEALRTAA